MSVVGDEVIETLGGTVTAVVAKAVADQIAVKPLFLLETGVVRFESGGALVYQDGNLNLGGATFPKLLDKELQRHAGLDGSVDNEDFLASDVVVEVFGDQRAAGFVKANADGVDDHFRVANSLAEISTEEEPIRLNNDRNNVVLFRIKVLFNLAH